jgi:hypothetical protein
MGRADMNIVVRIVHLYHACIKLVLKLIKLLVSVRCQSIACLDGCGRRATKALDCHSYG